MGVLIQAVIVLAWVPRGVLIGLFGLWPPKANTPVTVLSSDSLSPCTCVAFDHAFASALLQHCSSGGSASRPPVVLWYGRVIVVE